MTEGPLVTVKLDWLRIAQRSLTVAREWRGDNEIAADAQTDCTRARSIKDRLRAIHEEAERNTSNGNPDAADE